MNNSSPLEDTLPLENGALIVDNSFLEQLQCCPRMLQYGSLLKRQLAASRPSLNFGSAIHLALEHRYKNFGSDLSDLLLRSDCEAQQAELLAKFFAENPPPEDEWRNLNWAMEITKQYNERYSVEPFNLLQDDNGKPLVELTFAIPFAAFGEGSLYRLSKLEERRTPTDLPIIYAGRVDLPVLWDEHLFVMDHKTTSMLGESFWDELRVSPQQTGYCWAFAQQTGKWPIGFVVNAIRTRPMPLKPKNGVAGYWEETFQRNKEYLTTWHYQEWEQNTLALLEEFFFYNSKNYFPMKRKWCVAKYGRCQFYEVDYAPPHQRAELLSSSGYEDNTWSPLKKIGEK